MSRRSTRQKAPTSEASLQEQNRLLKLENETLRRYIAEHVPQGTNIEVWSTQRAQRPSTTSPSPNFSPLPHTGSKGCSCKGTCSTKACGCVKRNIPCLGTCKCKESLCKNLDPDKENIGDQIGQQQQLSTDGEESLKKLSNLTLAENKEPKKSLTESSPVNKRLRKVNKPRSIFSPDVDDNVFTFGDAAGEGEMEDAAEKSEENEPRTTAAHDGEGSKVKEEVATKSRKKKDKKDATTKTKNDRIPSNELVDDDVEAKPSKKSRKKVAKKEKETRVEQRRKRDDRMDSEHEEDEAAAVEVERAESDLEPADTIETKVDNNRPEKIAKKEKKTRAEQRRKRDDRMDSEQEEDEAAAVEVERAESDLEPADTIETKVDNNQPEKIAKKEKKTRAEQRRKRDDRMDSEQEEDEAAAVEVERAESDPEPADTIETKKLLDTFLDSPQAMKDFNPMKPRRQLSRSPLPGHVVTQQQRILDLSELPLPIPLKEEPEEELAPPAELEKDIVDDWDEHMAHLVKCSKCGRTFHPHRIKKHESSCIKI